LLDVLHGKLVTADAQQAFVLFGDCKRFHISFLIFSELLAHHMGQREEIRQAQHIETSQFSYRDLVCLIHLQNPVDFPIKVLLLLAGLDDRFHLPGEPFDGRLFSLVSFFAENCQPFVKVFSF